MFKSRNYKSRPGKNGQFGNKVKHKMHIMFKGYSNMLSPFK